ncbi:CGNR zinc finger domain-containing protein [Sphaerisporangium sp. NPDC051017]|uniref:CGNR zinc finger domain-containing protein n=1 Tax=Sphaerisporangium sp. NPDC051017 TaxID=3154636 RepID=UPI003433D229
MSAPRWVNSAVTGRPGSSGERVPVPVPPPVLGSSGRELAEVRAPVPALLSVIARDAIDLVTGPYSHRIRACQGPVCSVLFVDQPRPGTRRWCSMRGCGDSANPAEYRRRHREAAKAR